MPVFEMPLEELKTYKGRNPKPEDFDRFWDESIEEMRSVKSDLSVEPSSFQTPFAECF